MTAEDRARAWLVANHIIDKVCHCGSCAAKVASLAALLRESK